MTSKRSSGRVRELDKARKILIWDACSVSLGIPTGSGIDRRTRLPTGKTNPDTFIGIHSSVVKVCVQVVVDVFCPLTFDGVQLHDAAHSLGAALRAGCFGTAGSMLDLYWPYATRSNFGLAGAFSYFSTRS
jgi:hypothetical protein